MASPRFGYLSTKSLSMGDAPECSICNEKYDDSDNDLIARILACGHSMCSKCIFRCMHLNGRQVKGGMEVFCPNKCRPPTFVAESRIENLPKNFALMEVVQRERSSSLSVPRSTTNLSQSPILGSHSSFSSSPTSLSSLFESYNCDVCETSNAAVVCPNCSVVLCQTCSNDIHKRKGYHLHQLMSITEFSNSQGDLSSQSTGAISPKSSLSKSDSELSLEEQLCKHHRAEVLELFCETCYELVCKHCKLGEHREHECRTLLDVASEKKESLRSAVEKVNDCHEKWNYGFDSCHELQEHLFDKRRTLEADIKSHFHSIHSALHAREEALLSQVKTDIESRSKQLNCQANHLAKVCSVAKDLTEECETLIYQRGPSEVVRGADKVLAQTQQYLRSDQDVTPMVTGYIESNFDSEQELLEVMERLGQLQLAPDRVEDVQVKSKGHSTRTLRVSWQPPENSKTKDLVYLVEQAVGSGGFSVVYEGGSNECVVEGSTSGEDAMHQFRVAAINAIGKGPYCMPVKFTQQKAFFLWDSNLKHPKAHISNNGYTVSIGENALWVSVGTNIVLTHGTHYWEVVLNRYGNPSMSRKVVIGVVSSSHHQWHRSHGVIGIKTCSIGTRSWGLACGTAKKLNKGGTFLQSLGSKHNVFKEGDAVGVLLDLNEHKLAFYRNGQPLGIQFTDINGPVIPAISFCRNKTLTLRFPPSPEEVNDDPRSRKSSSPI